MPPGFIVTAKAYFDFLDLTDIDLKIASRLKNLDVNNTKDLNQAAADIQKEILKKPLPEKLAQEISTAYQKLYTGSAGNIFVAVRSSATAEDLPTASFAGQQKTFLNISGTEEVLKAVRLAWASLFEARAIYYRAVHKFEHLKVGIAVPVQKMVQSDVSGIMFTVDPLTGSAEKIVIEAGWGLGEAVVSGAVTPDRYVLSKKDGLKILEKKINSQEWKIVKVGSQNKHVTIAKDEQKKPKLNDAEIKEIARFGQKIEDHYKFPQDIEWAIEKGKIYFVQSRPVTTIKPVAPEEEKLSGKLEILVKGIGASLGIACGPVKIIHSPKEIDQVGKGEVLVTEKTNPDFVPAMRRAVGIVTDTGGVTSHAAIVSREMGIPCVVGTGKATSVLKMGQVISVDGAKGLVYKGKVSREESPPGKTDGGGFAEEIPVTATKVYVNLGEPSQAEKVGKLPADGVGLLRAEFIIAGIGEHPRALVKANKSEIYVNKLAEGISQICQAFFPRPVVYRATDFKTNEYRNLKGGEKIEISENNPMIGYRGAFRYLKEPDLFKLELEAVKKVRKNFENLWLMIPFVRTVEELQNVKEIIEGENLRQGPDFKLWMMVEIPSNVLLIDDFLALGIDGVSIGSNDLTQLILGIDRDSQILAEEFDERNEAVMRAMAHVIKKCRRRHVSCSICGQAATTYPEVVEMMVREGATSVSVSPDAIIATRRLIASVEKKLLLSKIIEG